MSTNLILAIISIIFGLLIIVFPQLLSIIVGIFFILLGIYLLVEYFGERKGTAPAQSAPSPPPPQVQETSAPENK